MAVLKTPARLVAADGAVIGQGRAYVHLRLPADQPQAAQGTLALDTWDDASTARGAALELDDGPRLALDLQSDTLSGCIQGRVLRYATYWPGR